MQSLNITFTLKLIYLCQFRTLNNKSGRNNKLLIKKTFQRLGNLAPWFNNCLVKVVTAKYFFNYYNINNQIIIGVDINDGRINGAHASMCFNDNTRLFYDIRFRDVFII